ncbi:probable glutamate receptor [Haliotis asinina]|uniref:probable glutamate receptor n=1 Tax=Haliotis asinina TaxID=109174 RepID=UPI003531AAA5
MGHGQRWVISNEGPSLSLLNMRSNWPECAFITEVTLRSVLFVRDTFSKANELHDPLEEQRLPHLVSLSRDSYHRLIIYDEVYDTLGNELLKEMAYQKFPVLQWDIKTFYALIEEHITEIKNLRLSSWSSAIFPNTAKGLNGRKLTIATLEWLSTIKKEIVDGRPRYVGFGIDIVDHLAGIFNFSYEIVEPEDQLWGTELPNETWTGIIGMLQRQIADMCPVPYFINYRRGLVVDFSFPITTRLHHLPRYQSSRLLFSFWCIFCVMMTAVYTGNLVALVSVSKETVPFDTLSELVQQVDFKVASIPGSYSQIAFKVMQTIV